MRFPRMRFSSGTSRWWITAYLAVTLVCTTGWLILGQRLAEQTGLRRQVWLANDFRGTPVINDIAREPALDFLDDDPRLPRRFISARWRGYWYVPSHRSFTLHVVADDYADIRIDGARIARSSAAARAVELDAGVHEVQIVFQQYAGAIHLSFSGSSEDGRALPLWPGYLFPERPERNLLRLASIVDRLTLAVGVLWVAGALGAAVFILGLGRRYRIPRRLWEAQAGLDSGSQGDRAWERGWRVTAVVATLAIAARAVWARLPGWNPDSLVHDDLVYGAIIRADLWSMLTVPIPMAPGLFVIWRGFYELFPDPEWSLQILPFTCGIAAIPVMYHVVCKLTGDRGLGLLAAAVTALNPPLARFTAAVHQYAFEFLVTALFLLAAVTLFDNTLRVDPRRFAKVALAAGVAPLFSVPSVFISFPIMHLGALGAIRDWRLDRSRALRVLGATVAYDLAVLVCYLLLRNRTNEMIRGFRFASGFMPVDSLSEAGSFLATNGQRLLEMGMGEVWLLFIVGLGGLWLVARRPWRMLGLVVVGFYAAFLLASALEVYPLGRGRTDIFAFPVSILLLASGAHLVTAAFPAVRLLRFAIAVLVATVVLVSPLRVGYRADGRHDRTILVEALAANERPDDGVIMTWSAGFLTAFYGQWPFEIAAYEQAANATQAKISRANTLHLPVGPRETAEPVEPEEAQGQLVRRFLRTFNGRRVWFVAFQTPSTWSEVTEALEVSGYAVNEVVKTNRGDTLFLAVRREGAGP